MAQRLVLLAAGGTGGHLFPAEALALALQKRDVATDLATDHRAAHFKFPAREIHIVESATFRGKDPLSVARTLATLAGGTLKAWLLLGRVKPAAVVGFGGYPTIPPLMAAALRRVPSVLHEQNAVMGRANRLLAPRVDAIATSVREIAGAKSSLQSKMSFTGNPVRPAVIAAAQMPYVPPMPDGVFRVLVFGGSQGARVMSEVVPQAVQRLPQDVRARLMITQQAREEDLIGVRTIYSGLKVNAETASFYADLPARIAQSHLIISRSGASTVAELSAIGRPAILVPLPHALDQDQRANAGVLQKAGGAIPIDQAQFTPDRLAAEIAALARDTRRLMTMAAGAKSAGTIDAADRLAALVMRVAGL
jgi:UDP-N-acetylglucosamine--N-acetylmuramyl-(pentapeptide) pyrophosphoryl-undecaprenol N-acetylglucosamine transferase